MKKALISLLLIISIAVCGCNTANPNKTPTQGSTEQSTQSTDSCNSCTDKDDNGICDICGGSVIVTVDLYALNDLHGKITDTAADEGVDELTAYLKQAYSKDDYHITLSSGDMWQGTAESGLTKGNLVTEWMNEIGTVSMTLGNHEFDWGEEIIRENTELADFPLLAINVYSRETNTLADYCSASVTVECGEATVGIIGAIGDCYSSISSDMTKDVYFKQGDQLTSLIKAESERLRDEGVDYIVLSLHDGYDKNKSKTGVITEDEMDSYYDPELSSGGYVDLVFEAHTHKNYVLYDEWGVYHLQGGGENRGLSHVEVNINFANQSGSIHTAEFVNENKYTSLEGDVSVDALLKKYDGQLSYVLTPLGTNASKRSSDYMNDLVADLYYKWGIETFGQDYDICLGGGFISARSPYSLSAGEIIYSDLYSLFPFNNQLVLCSVKGSDLKSKFIETTNSRYHICLDPSFDKNSIDDNGTYYIITDSYTSTYSWNNLTEITRCSDEIYARDLLADYISSGALAK